MGAIITVGEELRKSFHETGFALLSSVPRLRTHGQLVYKYNAKKWHLIGAMKSNRVLYPNGMRIFASAFAATRTQDQLHLVTVKGQEYLVHRYEGPINKLKKAVVLLAYAKDRVPQSLCAGARRYRDVLTVL